MSMYCYGVRDGSLLLYKKVRSGRKVCEVDVSGCLTVFVIYTIFGQCCCL